ncbi:MAG: DNA methyltransferase [Candidatus Hodarchaeota archaeon]
MVLNTVQLKNEIKWLNKVKRNCNCPENHLSCISAKDWTRNMIGVWEFDYEKRDLRDKKIHPAVFPISLAKKVISIYTHKGEVVLDPFNGVGTTLVAAKDLERHAIGIDLNPHYCKIAQDRLQFTTLDQFLSDEKEEYNYEVIIDDAMNLLDYIPQNSIDLVFTSPPYANILDKPRTNKSKHSKKRRDNRIGVVEQYSEDKRDLGTKKPDDFIKSLQSTCTRLHTVLKPKKRLIINIRDVVPFFIQPVLIPSIEKINFQLKNIVVWDKRKLIQNMGIFGWPSNFIVLNSAYEYIFEFIKV